MDREKSKSGFARLGAMFGRRRATDKEYQSHGFKHLRGVLPVDEVDRLADLIDKRVTPYHGDILRQDGNVTVNEFYPSSTLISNSILNAHLSMPKDLAPVRDSLRALITSPALFDSLHRLDGEDHYTVHQTLIFVAAQGTGPHVDSWSLDTAPRGFAHTLWIPLEDMDHKAGVPAVVEWPIGKVVSEAELGLDHPADISFRERHDFYCYAVADRLRAEGTGFQTSFMRRGDLYVWGSLTPHFTLPSTPTPRRRLSLQILLRPTRYPWGTYATQPTTWTPVPAERASDRFDFLIR